MLATTLSAQNIYICKDGDYTTQAIAEGIDIDLTESPDSITFSEPQIPWTVDVVYNGTTATVRIPRFVAEKVSCSSGTSSQVIIVNTDTLHEVTYNVSGSSTDGSLIIKSDYKMQVNLNNVTLTSSCGEAMRFKCGKRVALVMAEGSVNTFADSNDNGVTPDASDSHKACIYTKGHIELSGAGTLNVTGNYNHAIATKEYFKVKKTVKAFNILGAVGDGIHVGEYFQMNGGELTIDSNTSGDGLQVEYKTDSLDQLVSDIENTGGIVICDGTIKLTSGQQDTKCMKADGDIAIKGGTLVINAVANGSRGIQADGNVTISQDSTITTSVTITASGSKCTLEEIEEPHKCAGIKMDGSFFITGGQLTVVASGASTNGIKPERNYTATGGTVLVRASGTNSDGIKVAGNLYLGAGSSTTALNPGANSTAVTYSGTYTKVSGATYTGVAPKKK